MAKVEERTNKCYAPNRVGRLYKPHGRVAATASIPSKFQTIIITNDEKKGFNSGCKRFDSQEPNDSPGPAKYCTIGSLYNENNVSFSKKGYGNFVSKVHRFHVKWNPDSTAGPGQYDPNINVVSRHDYNRAKCSGNFHKAIAVKDDTKRFQTPGPNTYHVSKDSIGKIDRSSTNAVFTSTTKRELPMIKKTNASPAPNAYKIPDEWTGSNPRAAQAPFKSKTERNILPRSALLNPGPGAYNPYCPQVDGVLKRTLPRKHYLCISAPAMELPPEKPLPGPGQYNIVDYEGPPKQYISSSMFVSTTNRWCNEGPDSNPGPGAYNPKQGSKSFIYNADDKWI